LIAIRNILRVKDKKVTIELPNNFNFEEIEVIILPHGEEKKSSDQKKSLKGIFQKYADSPKISQEKQAWKNRVKDGRFWQQNPLKKYDPDLNHGANLIEKANTDE
jgi:hypothetical protein